MSDIFQEVDEDLRREEFNKLWKQYGGYIIGACVAIVIGSAAVVGWRAYQDHIHKAASVKYQAIVHSGEENAPEMTEDTAKQLAALEPSLTNGYRLLSEFERAAIYVKVKKYSEAITLLDSVAKDQSASKEMRDVAALKSAYLQSETASLADMRARIEKLAVPENAFRFSAQELLGYVAFRTGDLKSARDYFAAILADPTAPAGLRQRALDMAGLIAGKLPEPEVAPSEQSAAPAAQPKTPASPTH